MSKRTLLVAVCLTLSFHLACKHASAQIAQNPSNQQRSNSNQNSQPSPTDSVLQVDHPPSERHEAGNANSESQSTKQVVFDLIAQLPAWIQAVLAFLLFIWVIRQTRISDQQRKIMETQIKMTETIERAYIGVTDLKMMCSADLPHVTAQIIVGCVPTLYVTWHNGGATPAHHFRAVPYLSFGEQPERKGYLIDDDIGDMRFNFIPAGKVIADAEYPQAEVGFPAFTQEMVSDLNSGKKRLYAIIDAVYLDFANRKRTTHLEAIYDPSEAIFSDLYEYHAEQD